MAKLHLFPPLAIALLAILVGVGMDLTAKFAAASVSPWQTTWLRWAFGFSLVLPMWWRTRGNWRAEFGWLHLVRTALTLFGSYSFFYTLGQLEFATVIAIFFSEPLLTTVFARLMLGEAVSMQRWCGIVAGLAGVLIIARPGADALHLQALLMALAGAAGWGLSSVLVKRFGAGQPVSSLVFWLALLCAFAATPFAVADWRPLGVREWTLMLVVAVCGNLYMSLWLSALRRAAAARIASVAYLALPLAHLAGYLLFDERPDALALLGTAVIIASVALATREREPAGAPAARPQAIAAGERTSRA